MLLKVQFRWARRRVALSHFCVKYDIISERSSEDERRLMCVLVHNTIKWAKNLQLQLTHTVWLSLLNLNSTRKLYFSPLCPGHKFITFLAEFSFFVVIMNYRLLDVIKFNTMPTLHVAHIHRWILNTQMLLSYG
jgi:hypothetical protein